MNAIPSNPERQNFFGRVLSEIRKSPEESQRVIPIDYFEKLMTRDVLGTGDIKILLDSIEIALRKGEPGIAGLIKEVIENEYKYLLSIAKK